MDIVDWSEAAKNLMSSIGGILSSTGAVTLQATPKRKPKMSMQASRSSSREEKRRQTMSVDVQALKEAKGEHTCVAITAWRAKPLLAVCNHCSPTHSQFVVYVIHTTIQVQICIQHLYFIDFLPSEEKPRRPRAQTRGLSTSFRSSRYVICGHQSH